MKGEKKVGSKLCENKEKKRYDYVAGLLTGGFRAKNLTTLEREKVRENISL